MLPTEFFTTPLLKPPACPSDYLRCMQRAAEQHMEAYGRPIQQLLDHGETMMISRSALRFPAPDQCPDAIATRQYALRGVRAERVFRFLRGGEVIAEGINEYFCVKTADRRIFRPDWFMHSGEPFVPDLSLRRLTAPADAICCGTRVADERSIDYNGHVNNAYYCDFALDALGIAAPRQLFLQYSHEILPHTAFSLYRSEDGVLAFGRQNEEIAFVAVCE